MFKVRHCKLLCKDTLCLDLETDLALNLCTGDMEHTGDMQRRKKVKLENSWGANRKPLEESRGLHGVVNMCLFSFLLPYQISRKKEIACPIAF